MEWLVGFEAVFLCVKDWEVNRLCSGMIKVDKYRGYEAGQAFNRYMYRFVRRVGKMAGCIMYR